MTIIRLLLLLQLILPTGNNTWLVQVVSSGGFTGNGTGNFAISSEGRVLCSLREMQCPEKFTVALLTPLVEAIQPDRIPPIVRTVPNLCNDCITWTLTVRARSSSGVEQTYVATWDDLTRSQVAPELIRIFDAVVALRK